MPRMKQLVSHHVQFLFEDADEKHSWFHSLSGPGCYLCCTEVFPEASNHAGCILGVHAHEQGRAQATETLEALNSANDCQ